MGTSAAPRGLWLQCALLAAAFLFYAEINSVVASAELPGNGTANFTTVLPPPTSNVTIPTHAPNATTPANATSPTPTTTNTTAVTSNATTPSSVTTPINGSTVATTRPTPQTNATTVSVPTKSATVTSTSSSAAATDTPASASQKKTSKFDAGSFVGGIVLTLGILIVLYLGCKFYASKRGVQYRTIDEHEAII